MTVGSSSAVGEGPFSLTNFKGEKLILAGFLVAILGYAVEHALVGNGQVFAMVATVLLIGTIIMIAMRVAHHAEVLAEKVGEPYGTMILTLAAVLVEVVILAIMMIHNPSPTLARDTIVSAIHIDVNLLFGLAALLGGFKHGEQVYNDNSGRSYVVMIMAAIGISMVVPKFVDVQHWKALSIFTIGSMVILYALFLRMQTKEHNYFFSYNYEKSKKRQVMAEQHIEEKHESFRFSVAMLVCGIIVTGLLAEVMSKTMTVGLEGSGLPPIFAGMVVALISASPEIMTALKAAMDNKMQVVVNVALGASLSTVILTIPVIEFISLFTGHDVDMAMTPVQMALMGITLVITALNISDGESNAIEGGVHFVLFATFIFLSFIGM
jgi:Ca2+:H+ antiporter